MAPVPWPSGISWPQALLVLGFCVVGFSFLTFFVRFSPADEQAAAAEHGKALEERARTRVKRRFVPAPVQGKVAFTPLTALRIYLGIALAIKGVFFITNMDALESQMGGGFGQTSTVVAWFVVLAHAVGGAALALGFVTRFAAGGNMIVLLGAVLVTVT